MAGSIVAYCSCRNPDTGRRYPQGACPDWNRRGHRRWGYAVDLDRLWDEAQQRWRRQQARRMGYTTRRDAERALAREIPAVEDGTAPSLPDRQVTVAAHLDRWLGDPRWRATTRLAYQRDVRLYLRPGLGHVRLVDVRPEHIERLLGKMREGTLRPPGQAGPTPPAALRSVYATLRAALNAAVRERKITWNPCVAVRVETPARQVVQVWEPEHVARFLDHARRAAPELAPLFQLSAWRGLRRGELLALQWADLDLDGGTLRVRRNITEAGGRLHIGGPKTQAGERTVSLGAKLVAVLRAHRRAQSERRLAAGSWAGLDLVFCQDDGQPIAPHTLTIRFKTLARQVPGLPDAHLHTLRHTAATSMLLAGVPPKVVQDQLGHATLAMTMDLYGHVIASQRDASADAVERLYDTRVQPR